jgi:hypothetical protein
MEHNFRDFTYTTIMDCVKQETSKKKDCWLEQVGVFLTEYEKIREIKWKMISRNKRIDDVIQQETYFKGMICAMIIVRLYKSTVEEMKSTEVQLHIIIRESLDILRKRNFKISSCNQAQQDLLMYLETLPDVKTD